MIRVTDYTKIPGIGCLLQWAILFALFSACGAAPKSGFLQPPEESAATYSGYIVIASSANQAVSLLDPVGNFVKELVVLDGTTADTPYGIGIFDSDNVLVSVDGVDRVIKVNLTQGRTSANALVLNSNLTGNIRNITRLLSGDILVVETSNIERFTATGQRVTAGSWPKALQTTGSGLERMAAGGFVHCSTGTRAVRTYTDDGTQIATATNGTLTKEAINIRTFHAA